jgi:putative flippase GtrA
MKNMNRQLLPNSDLWRQFVRFLQVGVTNTVGTYLLYLALILILPYVIAYSITFVVGVLFSAWLNARYSFTIRLTGRTLVRFVIIYVINFMLSMQLLIVCVEMMNIPQTIAPLAVLAVFTPINFFSSRLALTGTWRRHQ